jgi:hypothetical protein
VPAGYVIFAETGGLGARWVIVPHKINDHFAAGASEPNDRYQQSAAARPIAVIAFRPIG